MTQSVERCLMCGQVLPGKAQRICGTCGRPILQHHKYYFDGSIVKHRCCEQPTEYAPVELKAVNR